MNTESDFHITDQLDPTYFVLGTLSDYMGRFEYVNKKSEIDRYYSYEKPLIDYISEMVKKELKFEIAVVPDTSPHHFSIIETFSAELSSTINSYYNDTYLIKGSLKNLPYLNYSYLTGKFYRYGRKINDSIYSIQIANSADYKICDSLLKRVGCAKIHFKYLNNIPAQFIYYFIPTPGLKAYFNYISMEKKKLDDSYYKDLMALMKVRKSKIRKMMEMNPTKYKEIIELFK